MFEAVDRTSLPSKGEEITSFRKQVPGGFIELMVSTFRTPGGFKTFTDAVFVPTAVAASNAVNTASKSKG
jgi:hypothetical protein